MEEKRLCTNCNYENESEANFCEHCGSKISETCPKCWIKKGQPYNCHYNDCPGYKLFILEKSKS
ncbi:MAG: zinc-ribbon domain-containing protein [Candidatus Micrarchaeota archaeon]|nr:zinc-ribbon domain-containing protein [Candidatus Micrarchaeota archaeon]